MSEQGRLEKEARPRIVVAYVRRGNTADARYLEAIERAGGIPVPLWAEEGWEEALAEAEGVLFTGGGDIDPRVYGNDEDCPGCEGIDASRDARELAVFRVAWERGLPMLGICRGMQLMNVLFANGGRRGELLADVPQDPVRHRSLPDGLSAFHPVTVVPETCLARILGGGGTYAVNSRHHQGMHPAQVAAGLVVSALAADDVVEAFEAPGERFFLGVQCHPERNGETPEFSGVIAELVRTARARRGRDGT